jgi:uncharacterized membrane protein
MRKESFKTKLTKKQKRNNILVILTIMICSYIFTLWLCYEGGTFDDMTLPMMLIIAGLGSFLVLSILMFPVVLAAIVLGIQMGRAKRVRDDATFVPVQNMEYYRDNLKELNPALVSLVIDLDIYGKNDIVATLLRMQNKKVIVMNENGRIGVNADNMDQLDAGERELLNMVKTGKLNNRTSLSNWKKNRFREAEELGYIRKKDTENKKGIGKYVIILPICFVITFIVCGAFFVAFLTRMDAVTLLTITTIFMAVVDTLVFVPIYRIFKDYGMRTRGDVLWERTELGNETAEKIAALRRFIRDFSMLSTAEKEEALLWEDYLVYTIVLEDNEKIVKEISKQFAIDLHGLDRLRAPYFARKVSTL